MTKRRRLYFIVAALLISLCIHASAVWAEEEGAAPPAKVVKDFAAAYFKLDASMAEYLSKSARINENGVDMVELYLSIKDVEARDRGYKTSYLKMHPILMKTHVLNMDDSSAQIQFHATTLRNINPLFRIVGYIFGLIEEHEVQDTITVVLENGEWKVGPGALGLAI